MKKWKYRLPTGSMWCSFDYGTVVASTEDEALKKASDEIDENLKLANENLKSLGFEFTINYADIIIEEVPQYENEFKFVVEYSSENEDGVLTESQKKQILKTFGLILDSHNSEASGYRNILGPL